MNASEIPWARAVLLAGPELHRQQSKRGAAYGPKSSAKPVRLNEVTVRNIKYAQEHILVGSPAVVSNSQISSRTILNNLNVGAAIIQH